MKFLPTRFYQKCGEYRFAYEIMRIVQQDGQNATFIARRWSTSFYVPPVLLDLEPIYVQTSRAHSFWFESRLDNLCEFEKKLGGQC
jgi:hypothetical protein